ncbi:pentapeptide repeat-containing protein [Burkholderia sp. RF4-BP95]|uniref:pentapeptide repeat-containing protein n=1 Tax=Burkholderia sp. RF4-BP95 TaxID=1637845 RepID=UPI000758A942|nr:pentapeptide repeat-containing protein [Burkholderia sp. RF4-BP95]KUY86219.1 hypothetical protein WS46_05065 [Burkholderia sp. RF4-BP95]
MRKWFLDGDNGLKRFYVTILLISLLVLVSLGLTWATLPVQIWPFDSSYGIYNKDFWSSCLVNFHTSVVDFALLTIIAGKITDKIDKAREESRIKSENVRRINDELRIFEESRILGKASLLANNGVSHKAFFALLQLGKMDTEGFDSKTLDASELNFSGLSTSKGASYANFNFSQSDFSGCSLEKWEFIGCLMRFAIFSGNNTKISKTQFTGCNLEGGVLDNVNLLRSEFTSCSLKKSSFKGATLAHVIFRRCDFDRIDFSGANLKNCSFHEKYPTIKSLQAAINIFPVTLDGKVCQNWLEYKQAGGK